jgi:hypothetical protein
MQSKERCATFSITIQNSKTMIKFISGFTLTALLFMAACNETDDIVPSTSTDTSVELTTSEDISNIQYMGQEVDLLVDEIADTRDPGDCPDITLEYPRGKFPNTITIAFGDSCVRRHDHVLSGNIIVQISAPKHEEGATRTITFDDFTIDGVVHAGSRTITNTGVDDEGNITLSKEVDVQLEFPTGETAIWQANYIVQQTQGGSTPVKLDDAFRITGGGNGVNRNGHAYEVTITEPLVHFMSCRWLISGIISNEVTIEGEVQTHSVYFGYPAGECDNLALVSLADGTEKEIRIRRRWW